jgi:hypothetical protein
MVGSRDCQGERETEGEAVLMRDQSLGGRSARESGDEEADRERFCRWIRSVSE